MMSNVVFDPQSAPIDTVANEVALDQSRLNLTWIRQRFNHPPIWQPEVGDAWDLFATDNKWITAAVLIVLVQRNNGLQLIFTQRTSHLAQHAGQISFPGGRMDNDDSDITATALRETHEEIGLSKEFVEVLGKLPDYFTITGYRVTPIVAAVTNLPKLTSNVHEVDEIFEVPLSFLMSGHVYQRRSAIFQHQQRRSFYTIPYRHYLIWGATAGMLRNLFHFLRA